VIEVLRITPGDIRNGWVQAERCPRCLSWHSAGMWACGEVTVELRQVRCRRCGELHCVEEGLPEPLCPACEPAGHPLTFAERDERAVCR
jgi:hypothetical protein